ncbi:MAG: transporter [Ignavibacteria bacterium]|nr:transporter [Ignavibacteria bacterium]
MQPFFNLLAENPLLLLFTVIGFGFLLGNIKIGGFSLGVAAVLFVGIAFSAMDNRLHLPESIYIIGLVMFVYAIGLQSGPGFFASFQKRGFRINAVSLFIISAGALITFVVGTLFQLSSSEIVGLFCGALTNTPALAATVETIKQITANSSSTTAEIMNNSPVVIYGLVYPFGVLGVILWCFIFNKYFKTDFEKETKETAAETILSKTFKVTNPAIVGKTIEMVLKFVEHAGFTISRIRRGEMFFLVTSETTLEFNDYLIIVGTESSLEKAYILFGDVAEINLNIGEQPSEFSYRRIFVSNKSVVGKTIRELNLQQLLGATITRLLRGDVEFVPSLETTLELGDRIRVVTKKENMERVTKFFGDSVKAISETDFLSVSLGIVLGVFLGMVPFPLPNGMTFKLGFAGGPLIVALLLGKLERTGPITWSMPLNANLVLRQLGLVFFLSGIGTKAGKGFAEIFLRGGIEIIIAGAIITSLVTICTIVIGYKFLHLPMSSVLGILSGVQTQPAVLAYANQQAQNELPNLWYATVYPASMIAKIILAQVLVSLLLFS